MTVAEIPSAFQLAADLLAPPQAAQQTLTLGHACRHPQQLGADIHWWPQQLAMLDTLDDPAIELYLWAVGRQAGKTSMAAATAVHNALWRPDLDQILPRSRTRYILIAGANRDGAHEVIRVIRGLLEQIQDPPVRSIEPYAGRIEIVLPSGRQVCIRAMATWGRSIRGLSASLAILDEFAHVAQTEGPGADQALYAGLTPALRAFGHLAKRLIISTPSGRSGKFYELFDQASNGLLPAATARQATVTDIVPGIDPAWLDAQRLELGDALYQQEYEASFIEGGGAFFSDLHAVDWASAPAMPADGTGWTVALDPAFHADGFGYAVLGHSRHQPGRLIGGPVGAIVPESDARTFDARRGREDQTLAQVFDIISPYQPSRVTTDQHQSTPIVEYFERRGIPVEPVNITGPIQTSAFVALRARLADGSVQVAHTPELVEELRRVRAKTGTTGVHLPRHGNSHCDIAMALALCVWASEDQGGPPAAAGMPAAAGWRTSRYGDSEYA